MLSLRKTVLGAAVAAAIAAPAFADDQLLTIHGFGNQDYWRSGSTSFQNSGPHGTWENDDLGLVFRGTVNDKVHLNAMIQADATDPVQTLWAFVDYQVNDDLTVKAGRVKFPFGIYNEYVDTRGLQLAALTPLMYYDALDIVHDAYQGVGVDYDLHFATAGKLTLQPFVGNTFSAPASFTAPAYNSPLGLVEADTNDRSLYGFRATWETPVDGLHLLLSDYTTDKIDIKSEYAHHHFPALSGYPGAVSTAWYLQGGYHLGDWTPYARYDAVVADTSKSGDPSYYQRDFVIGIDRLLANNLHARIENHFNHGYAMPVLNGDIAAGTGKVDWSLLAVQINYMF